MPPSFSGHQSALFAGIKKQSSSGRTRGALASFSAEGGPEHVVAERMTTRDEGRTNMRPTATVCSIAPSRHCSAR